MPFVLLLLAFLLYVQEPWAAPRVEATPDDALIVNLAGYGAFVLLAAVLSLIVRAALKRDPFSRVRHLRRFAVLKRLHFLGLTTFFITGLYLFGWGWAVNSLIGDRFAPLVKPLVLAPYLTALILSWAFYYDVDRTAHHMIWHGHDERYLGRFTYLVLNVRHNLLLLIPPLVLMIGQDVLQSIFPELKRRDEFPLLTIAVLGSLMIASALSIPWLLRSFLGLTPLPDGDLRDHLIATARRIGFRFSDILVWNTRGTVANALVTGLIPQLRYVVLTDRIIKELSVDEIESVFGHEVGHVKHHHMALYTLFLLMSLVLLALGWKFGADLTGAYLEPVWPGLAGWFDQPELFLGLVVVYVFLVFGLLSRNCERQADLYGCHVATRDAFIRALEKVADINGMSREKPGIFTAWQHWTVGQRVAFLRRLDDDPSLEERTQRRIGILKWSLTLVLTAGILVLLSSDHPWNWLRYL